jgi:NAD(P)-dependent dehydrogenase (short-subunit alcohol dehydrogenase family)
MTQGEVAAGSGPAGAMAGRVAVVTGAAGTVGRGVCRALTGAGAAVVALDLDTSALEGSVALAIDCDVTDADACRRAVERTVAQLAGVDVLVNLAQRAVVDTPVLALDDRLMAASFATGPMATVRMMQLCHPHLRARGGGTIVNAGSNSGTDGTEGRAAYAAAKEAIRGITKVAAKEWGGDNIRVNAICPWVPADPMSEWARQKAAASPLGRVGDAESDVGSLVVFLATTGTFMTGRTLFVDGGIGTWR